MAEIEKIYYEEFIRLLNLTVNMTQMDSSQHLKSQLVIKKSFDDLQKIMDEDQELVLSLKEGTLCINEQALDKKETILAKFAEKFSKNGIASLSFSKAMTFEEFRGFFHQIHINEETLETEGGTGNAVKEKDLHNLKVEVPAGKISSAQPEKDFFPLMADHPGVSDKGLEGAEEVLKYSLWKELTFEEKTKRVLETATLGKYEVKKAREVFQELLFAGRIKDAQSVLNKFFQAINNPSREVRTELADNVPSILKILDETSKEKKIFRYAYNFLLKAMEKENDSEVLMRMAGALSFKVTILLAKGNFTDALEILRGLAESQKISNDSRFEGERHNIFPREIILKILEALREKKGEERESIFQTVVKIGDLAIEPILETLSRETSMGIRSRLIRTITPMGESAVEHLIPRLSDGRWAVVKDVAIILGEIKSERTVKPLIDTAKHQDARVRKEAFIALSKIDTEQARKAILTAFDDGDYGILALAADLVIRLEMKEAIPILIKMVKKTEKYQAIDMESRKKAITALGRLAPQRALTELSGLLEKKGLFTAEEPAEIKACAAMALGFSGHKKAIEGLERLSKKETKAEVKEAAQKAIALIRSQIQQ